MARNFMKNGLYTDKKDIEQWMRGVLVPLLPDLRYDIVPDHEYEWSVDVVGYVGLSPQIRMGEPLLKNIMVKFNRVEGTFCCSSLGLDNLYFAPRFVSEDFTCGDNNLKTLEGCPQYIGGMFYCSKNPLTNLVGGPRHVGLRYECQHCGLESLEGMAAHAKEVMLDHNRLKSMEFLPNHIAGLLHLTHNLLEDLRFAPKLVGAQMELHHNLLTSLKGIENTTINGVFSIAHNRLEYLDALPLSAQGISFYNNPLDKKWENLKSLEAMREVMTI